jgi:hypothetical protein
MIELQFFYPVFLKRNIPHVTNKIIEIPECCYMEILVHFLLVVKVNTIYIYIYNISYIRVCVCRINVIC